MEFFSEALQRHLQILDNRIALLLRGECLFSRAIDRVFEKVVKTPDARGFLLIDQRLAAGCDQQRLHVTLGLREVKELATVGLRAHLNDLSRLIEANVREATGWDGELRIATLFGCSDDAVGQLNNQAMGLDVDRRQLRFGCIARLNRGRCAGAF